VGRAGRHDPGFRAVPEARAVLAAVRDLEPYQRAALERSEVVTVPGAFAAADLERSLDGLRADVDRVYLHLDLDALDAREGRPNAYAAEDGPELAELERAIDAVFARFAVVAAALTAYDPAADTDGRAGAAARRLVARMAARALERAA